MQLPRSQTCEPQHQLLCSRGYARHKQQVSKAHNPIRLYWGAQETLVQSPDTVQPIAKQANMSAGGGVLAKYGEVSTRVVSRRERAFGEYFTFLAAVRTDGQVRPPNPYSQPGYMHSSFRWWPHQATLHADHRRPCHEQRSPHHRGG